MTMRSSETKCKNVNSKNKSLEKVSDSFYKHSFYLFLSTGIMKRMTLSFLVRRHFINSSLIVSAGIWQISEQ